MGLARRLARLKLGDVPALAMAATLLLALRACLGLLSFPAIWRGIQWTLGGIAWVRTCAPDVSRTSAAFRAVRAVETTGRYLLGTDPCLPQALAVLLLLHWHGLRAELRIGVRREGAELRAHAWVASHDRIMIGGERSPKSYVPLPALPGGM